MITKTMDDKEMIYDSIDEFEIREFIDVGGESIVFKGVKRSVGRTYALKFRGKDRWDDFIDYELKALGRLEQCSTSKLAGIIYEIPRELTERLWGMIPESKTEKCRKLGFPEADYFCVVEDYISGCNLKEYCEGNEAKGIFGHTPSLDASFEQVIDFQRKLIGWIMQFCEIMIHVTEDNNYLHLDIKPENIMISNETESVTVIDFGKSIEFKNDSRTVSLAAEFGENIGIYGTAGFAAPECCDLPQLRNDLRLPYTGNLDVRSDIFSFGATLWDCINPQPNVRIKHTEQGYFRRDLFNTPRGYISELEDIIVKCTEKDPDDRYRDYNELKEAAVYAEKKLLEKLKPSKTLLATAVLAVFVALMLTLTIVVAVWRSGLSYEVALNDFNKAAANYTESNLEQYKEKAEALLKARPDEEDSYDAILENLYIHDGTLSRNEVSALLKFLDYTDDDDIKNNYVKTMIQKAAMHDLSEILSNIYAKRSVLDIECPGMRIAEAYTNYKDDAVTAYEVIKDRELYQDYAGALSSLCAKLANDEDCKEKIAAYRNVDKDYIYKELNRIKKQLDK